MNRLFSARLKLTMNCTNRELGLNLTHFNHALKNRLYVQEGTGHPEFTKDSYSAILLCISYKECSLVLFVTHPALFWLFHTHMRCGIEHP